MYDDEDEEYEEEETPQVVEIYEEELFDEDEDEEEDSSAADALSASYAAKGFSDRAAVDEQARADDVKKRQKREKLAQLKQSALTMKSTIGKKERELHDLELEIGKDRRSETRERVVLGRQEATLSPDELREMVAEDELKDVERQNDRVRREELFESLKRDMEGMKKTHAETVRAIAMLEQELLRS